MSPALFAETVGMQISADDAAEIIRSLADAGYEIRRKPVPRGNATAEPAGLAFERAHLAAKRAAWSELGPRWHLVAGESQWISLPPRLRSYRFRRSDGTESVRISNPRDYRAPAPRFWPDGRLPAGVETA